MTKRLLEPVVVLAAALYFIFDFLLVSVLKPLTRQISKMRVFHDIAIWIESLAPYSTLALIVVPLLILEPVKPVSAYFLATGNVVAGLAADSESCMPAIALKTKLKTFHATLHVVRAEEWCVEAETAEDAHALLAAGAGHRCHSGDRVHSEVHELLDDN